MPIDFFDYETKFEGQTMVNRLKSYKPDGEQYGDFIETWEIMDENHYTWTLSQKSDGKKVMGGNFVRKKKKD